MFGKVTTRYRGGTGHSQEGASRERQERENEEGISKARQTLVIGHLKVAGPLGLTIRELCDKTGWHHGQSSNALSILDTITKPTREPMDVVRIDEKRGKQSVYVLEMFRQGRPIARHRRSAADILRDELAKKNAEIESLKKTVGLIQTELAEVDKKASERVVKQLAEADAEVAKERNRRVVAENAAYVAEQQVTLAASNAEQLQEELDRMTRENSAHRISAHLRMNLEPDERPVIERVRGILDKPAVAAMPDTEKVSVTLNVLRTMVSVISRSTRLDDETPGT